MLTLYASAFDVMVGTGVICGLIGRVLPCNLTLDTSDMEANVE